ncbi:MAG: rRNA pseudouridine synthase [Anaeroplasmataceae bacterium]|nr:rRNA pseudouridine synthase [Anaeroplasmataceae bacterium]
MAASGVASRRKCEEIISLGLVKVNGKVVTELGTKVSKKDLVEVDGKPLQKESLVYYVLYKPTGYLTAVSDKLGRRIVMDLIAPELLKQVRLFPIGRLDYDTSGVLLLTNDGTLSYRLTRSAKEIEKVYQVRIDGLIDQKAVNQLMKGILLDGVLTKRAKVEVLSLDKKNNSSLLLLTITEGRNRQVRRMCEAIGYPVKKLKRVSFGGVTLDGLSVGAYRMLKPHEVKVLYGL